MRDFFGAGYITSDTRKVSRRTIVTSLMRLVIATVLAVGVASSLPEMVWAQDDVRTLFQRIEQLEQDLAMVRRSCHQDEVQGTASSSTLDNGSNSGEEVAVRLQQRLVEIDDLLAHLTGQVEEARFALDQLRSRVEKLVADTDYRLTEIEHRLNVGSSTEGKITGAINTAPVEKDTAPVNSKSRATKTTIIEKKDIISNPANHEEATLSGYLNTRRELTAKEQSVKSEILHPDKGQEGTWQVTSLKESIKEQYSHIVTLLNQANYAEAEQAALAFLEVHPGDALAGHVQYWLGETYYARGAFRQAAATFAKGYQKYAKSDKAPANVLKLGLSLIRLERIQDACIAFNRLVVEFPNTTNDIKQRAVTERKQLGCR